MDNKLKYSEKYYKRDNIIHTTEYYQIIENNISIFTTINRLTAYKRLSYLRHEKPKNNYKMYLHTINRLKTYPKEKI